VQEEVVGQIQYIDYDLENITGEARAVTSYVLDLYSDKTNTPVNNDMTLSFEPSWKGVKLEKEYVVNTNIIPNYANRSGSNYIGHNGTYLEFNAAGALRWWSDFGYAVRPNKENDGWIKGWGRYRTHLNYKYENFTLPKVNFDKFEFNVSLSDNTEWLMIYPFRIYVNTGSEVYYLHDKNTDQWVTGTEPEYEWTTEEKILYIHKRGAGRLDVNFQVPRVAYDYEVEAAMQVRFYNAFQNAFSTPFPVSVYMRHLKIRAISNEWELQGYKMTDDENFDLYPDNKIDNRTVELNWGMYDPGFTNDHAYSLSHPLTSTGAVINQFKSEWFTDYKYLTLPIALRIMMMNDNAKLSRKLSGTVRSFELTPLTLVKDTEGYYYHILDWEYNDRTGFWSINAIECKNYEAAAIAGDYDTADYNDDYYK
jgi:hypothetical protein